MSIVLYNSNINRLCLRCATTPKRDSGLTNYGVPYHFTEGNQAAAPIPVANWMLLKWGDHPTSRLGIREYNLAQVILA